MNNTINEYDKNVWIVVGFYLVLFIAMIMIIIQIKYIDYNDNFRNYNKNEYFDKITQHYLDIGLTLNEAKVMTKLFKQLKLEYIDINDDYDMYRYINKRIEYPQDFYNKKLYKNIIKNNLKTD